MRDDNGFYLKRDYSRIPRKKKKLIPKDTFYCYKPTSGWKTFEDGRQGIECNYCPFHTMIKLKDKPEKYQDEIDKEFPEERVEWCKLVKTEIMDSCKSCGERYGI